MCFCIDNIFFLYIKISKIYYYVFKRGFLLKTFQLSPRSMNINNGVFFANNSIIEMCLMRAMFYKINNNAIISVRIFNIYIYIFIRVLGCNATKLYIIIIFYIIQYHIIKYYEPSLIAEILLYFER